MNFKLNKSNSLLTILMMGTLSSFAQTTLPQLGKSPIAEVVKAMTLEEKAGILVGQGSLFSTCSYIGSSSAGINNSANFQYTATTYNQTTHETFTFGNAQTTAAVGFEYA